MSEETTDASKSKTIHVSNSPSLTGLPTNTIHAKRNIKRDIYANETYQTIKICNDSRCAVKRTTKYTKDQKEKSNNSCEA